MITANGFNRAAAHAFGGMGHKSAAVAARRHCLRVVAAIAVTPTVDLVLTCECFVTECAARCEAVCITCQVARPSFVNVKTRIRDRLLADGAAKMFRMPIGI